MKPPIKKHYDKDYDILSINWGGQVEHSIELFDGNLILDINKEDDIVGLELFDFLARVEKHNKKMEKLFKKHDKQKGEGK